MARRSSSSSSSRKPAPAPARAHKASPPPPAAHPPAPAPTMHAPAPMQAPQQSGGMLAGLGATMAQGFAFGTGSALARTAVDSMLGGSSSHSAPAPAPVASAPTETAVNVPNACRFDYQAFQDCLNANKGNGGSCEFYYNALKACQESNI